MHAIYIANNHEWCFEDDSKQLIYKQLILGHLIGITLIYYYFGIDGIVSMKKKFRALEKIFF